MLTREVAASLIANGGPLVQTRGTPDSVSTYVILHHFYSPVMVFVGDFKLFLKCLCFLLAFIERLAYSNMLGHKENKQDVLSY